MTHSHDVLYCIQSLTALSQSIRTMGFVNRLNKDVCSQIITESIALIYNLSLKESEKCNCSSYLSQRLGR